MSQITDLAMLAVTKFGLQGIDWAALAAKGRSSVWDTDYIQQYMAPAASALVLTVGTLDLGDRTAIQVMQDSYSVNQSALDKIASSLLQLANMPDVVGTFQVQIDLDRESIRYMVSHAYSSALYAYQLHLDETIHHSGFSDAEIASHANTAVAVMNSIVLMDKLGAFSTLGLKAPGFSGACGLGIAPALIVAGTVVAIAFLALLAWVIVSMHDLNSKNAIVAQTCQQAQASGDAATTQQCINTLTDPNRNAGTALPNTVTAMLKSLIPYALGGVALYALFLAAPSIIKIVFDKKVSA